MSNENIDPDSHISVKTQSNIEVTITAESSPSPSTPNENENENSTIMNTYIPKPKNMIPGLDVKFFDSNFDSTSFELYKLPPQWTKNNLEDHITLLKKIRNKVTSSLHNEVEKHYSEAMNAMEAVTKLQHDVSWTALSCSTTRSLLTNFRSHVIKPHLNVVNLWTLREKRIKEINILKEISEIEDYLQRIIPDALMSLSFSKAIKSISYIRKITTLHKKANLYAQVLDYYEQHLDPILSTHLGSQLINFNSSIFEKIVNGYFVRDSFSPKQFFMDFSNQADSILKNICSSIVAWHVDHSSNELYHMFTLNKNSGKTTCAVQLAISDWSLIHAHSYLNTTEPNGSEPNQDHSNGDSNDHNALELERQNHLNDIDPNIVESLGLDETGNTGDIGDTEKELTQKKRRNTLSHGHNTPNTPTTPPLDSVSDFIPQDYSDWYRQFVMLPSSFNPLAKPVSKTKQRTKPNHTVSSQVDISDLLDGDSGEYDDSSHLDDTVFLPRRYRFVCRLLCLTRTLSGSSHQYSTLVSAISSICAATVEIFKNITRIIQSFQNNSFEFFDEEESISDTISGNTFTTAKPSDTLQRTLSTSSTNTTKILAQQHAASVEFSKLSAEKIPSILDSLVKQSQILLSSLLTCPPIDEHSKVEYNTAIKNMKSSHNTTDSSDGGSGSGGSHSPIYSHDKHKNKVKNKTKNNPRSNSSKKNPIVLHVAIASCSLEAFTSFTALISSFTSICNFITPNSSLTLLNNALNLLSQRYLENWHTKHISKLSNYLETDSWIALPTDTLIPAFTKPQCNASESISGAFIDKTTPLLEKITLGFLYQEFHSLSSTKFSSLSFSAEFQHLIQNSSMAHLPPNFVSFILNGNNDENLDIDGGNGATAAAGEHVDLINDIISLDDNDLSLFTTKLVLLPHIASNNPYDCLTIDDFTQKLANIWTSYVPHKNPSVGDSSSPSSNAVPESEPLESVDSDTSIPVLLSPVSNGELHVNESNTDDTTNSIENLEISFSSNNPTSSTNEPVEPVEPTDSSDTSSIHTTQTTSHPTKTKTVHTPSSPFNSNTTLTQSTFYLVKLFPKYLKFIYHFPSLSPQIFVAFTQLLDYSFYSILLLFGIRSHQFPCTHFPVKEPGLSIQQFSSLLDPVVEYSELFKSDSDDIDSMTKQKYPGSSLMTSSMSTAPNSNSLPILTDIEKATKYADLSAVNIQHLLFDSKTSSQISNCILRWHLLSASSFGSGAIPHWVPKHPSSSTFSIRMPSLPLPLSETRPVQSPNLFDIGSRFTAFQAVATLSQFIYGIQPLFCGTVLFHMGSSFSLDFDKIYKTSNTIESNESTESTFGLHIVENPMFSTYVERATMCQVAIRSYYQQIVASIPGVLALFFRNIVSNPGFAGGGFLEGRHHSDFLLAKHELLQKLPKPTRNMTSHVADFYRWFSLYGPPLPVSEIIPWDHHSIGLWKFENEANFSHFTKYSSSVKLSGYEPINLKWSESWHGLVWAIPPRSIPISPLSMMISADTNWEKPLGHHHVFVDLINHEVFNLHSLLGTLNNLNNISTITLQLFWSAVCSRLYIQLLKGLSTVTKCTDDGRASMKIDTFDITRNLVLLLTRETHIFSKPKPIPFASRVDPYINAWFMDFSIESNEFFAWCDSNHKLYAPDMLTRLVTLVNNYSTIDSPLSISDMEAKINTYYARTRLGSVKDFKWSSSSTHLPKTVHLGNLSYSFPSILPIKTRHGGFKLDLNNLKDLTTHGSGSEVDGSSADLSTDDNNSLVQQGSKTLRNIKSFRGIAGALTARSYSIGSSLGSDATPSSTSSDHHIVSPRLGRTTSNANSSERGNKNDSAESSSSSSGAGAGSKIATFGKSFFRRNK